MNSAILLKALAKPRGHRGPRGVGHVMIDGATRRMRPRSPMASLTFAPDIVTDGLSISLIRLLCCKMQTANVLFAL